MKFCPECGKKLAQPNPKFCPNCGGGIKARQASKEQAEAQPKPVEEKPQPKKAAEKPKIEPKEKPKPQEPLRTRLARAAIYIALAIAFIAIALFLPVAYSDQADKTGAQYYQYYTAFKNDVNGLEFLGKQYDNLTLNNVTLGLKARMAGNYALKAKQSQISWDYFQSFSRQNEGLLQGWNVNTSEAQSQINDSKSAVRKTATSMRTDLNAFAGTMQSNSSEVSDALGALGEVSR